MIRVEKGYLTARDLGLSVGELPSGPRNSITDVQGVTVGHCTVTDERDPAVQTGVTVVIPHPGNTFLEKVIAACHVINGFGKSMGLVQLSELGQLESPIALTNTLSVPTVADGLLDHLLAENPDIGVSTGSVNPVVGECNDSYLNDLRGRHVRQEHVARAIADASSDRVRQGSVGAGRAMSAFELKGGIGSASRVMREASLQVTVGVLVVSNLGLLRELTVLGRPVGKVLAARRGSMPAASQEDVQGSIMVVVATDAPLSERQLGRVLRRVQNGVARTGSTTAHGSGEIVIGFTTAVRIPHYPLSSVLQIGLLREDGQLFDQLFAAVTEATEEAILNSMFNAEPVNAAGNRLRDQPLPIEDLPELMGSPCGCAPRV